MLPVSSIHDPRLDPYRALKDRELARDGDRFIAEGELVVRRLLGSDYPVESVLLAERRAERLAPLVPEHVPVYVAPEELLRPIIGYKFQSGVIAVGRRKPQILLEQLPALRNQRVTLMICPETASAQNMGALIRISAAFGFAECRGGRRNLFTSLRQR
jgi:tRNA G18 (ribose-2'-O)-methylase SpoU